MRKPAVAGFLYNLIRMRFKIDYIIMRIMILH